MRTSPPTADAAAASADPMTPEMVAAHLERRLGPSWAPDAVTSVVERSEGNINVVYLVERDDDRVIVKQGLPFARAVRDWPLPATRTVHEARFYRAWHAVVPHAVPEVMDLDEAGCVLVMEFLDDCRLWRDELLDDVVDVEAARDLGTTLGAVAFGTSAYGIGQAAHEREAGRIGSPELAELMADVMFVQPWTEHERNDIPAVIADDVRALRALPGFAERVAELHLSFLTRREVLTHGDLHTSSIMVGRGRARVFDGEFARTGPAGFDLGEVWGNLLLAAIGAAFRGSAETAERCLELIRVTAAAYAAEFARRWPSRLLDHADAACAAWIARATADAVGFAGLEVGRRQIGLGKMEDIETLPADARSAALRFAIAECGRWVTDAGDDLDSLIGGTARRLAEATA